MVFIACGLNYKTAPLAIREQIALPEAMQASFLQQLIQLPFVHEAVLLSTCNRTELYCETDNPVLLDKWLLEDVSSFFSAFSPYFYCYSGNDAIVHALRVACGLDSMMLGEPQILGQMKQAYQQARQLGTAGPLLRTPFDAIFRASKRIRNLSGIGANPVSVAYAAVQLIGKQFNNDTSPKVLVIGTGETATLVAKYLYKQGFKNFYIASRTLDNALELAKTFNGKGLTITEIPEYLKQVDIVITATACPVPFINKELVELALTDRGLQPMFFLDLAVPRDIEADVGELPHVHLYNIDDLHQLVDKGLKERHQAALKAEQLIELELSNYLRWHRSRRANKMICTYRKQMKSLAHQELTRAQNQLADGLNSHEVLQQFCDRLVKKLIHTPTVGLKQAASDGREEILDLTHYLLNVYAESITL